MGIQTTFLQFRMDTLFIMALKPEIGIWFAADSTVTVRDCNTHINWSRSSRE